jgi:hypothetical protein
MRSFLSISDFTVDLDVIDLRNDEVGKFCGCIKTKNAEIKVVGYFTFVFVNKKYENLVRH